MAMRENNPRADAFSQEEELQRLMARFGWEITDVLKDRYLNDPWVYNLVNAALRLQQENNELRQKVLILQGNPN